MSLFQFTNNEDYSEINNQFDDFLYFGNENDILEYLINNGHYFTYNNNMINIFKHKVKNGYKDIYPDIDPRFV